MDWTDITDKYPEIKRLLPQDFWDAAELDHPIILNARKENKQFFQQVQELIQSVPATEICSSSQKANLDTSKGFESVLSEFIGYAIVDKWLCDSPSVVDGKDSGGGPEFHCDEIDIEVARLRESREVDKIRSFLSDKMNHGIEVEINEKDDYNLAVSTKQEWTENEETVSKIIDNIDSLRCDQLPERLEIGGLEIQIRERSDYEGVRTTIRGEVKEINEMNNLQHILEKKTEKKHRGYPLVFFIDIQRRHSYQDQEEILNKTIGKPVADLDNEYTTSQRVLNLKEEWKDYMRAVDRFPKDDPVPTAYDKSGNPVAYGYCKITPDSEGVFAKDELSNVAGVLFRTAYDKLGYVPNVYTTDIDAKGVYDRIGLETGMANLQNFPDLPSLAR